MVNWSELHSDLWWMIAKQIDSVEDFIAFGAVCSTFRSVTLRKGSTQSLQPLHWLVLPPKKKKKKNQSQQQQGEVAEEADDDDSDEKDESFMEFYSFTKKKTYRLQLPEIRWKRLFETKGWFFTVSEDREVGLFQPFSRSVIPLPPLSAFGPFFDDGLCPLPLLKRAMLSSSPNSSGDGYIVAVIPGFGAKFFFWKPGNNVWTVIRGQEEQFDDFTYSRGKLFAINLTGFIYCVDVMGPNPTRAVKVGGIPEDVAHFNQLYLVEWGEDSMLVITRHRAYNYEYSWFDDFHYGTFCFKVYEAYLQWDSSIIEIDDSKYWREVKDLGGKALFLGHNESICIEPSQFPPGIVKPNCIYFTDDCSEFYWCTEDCPVRECPHGGGEDMGVYSLEDGTIERFYNLESLTLFTPVWAFLTY